MTDPFEAYGVNNTIAHRAKEAGVNFHDKALKAAQDRKTRILNQVRDEVSVPLAKAIELMFKQGYTPDEVWVRLQMARNITNPAATE